MFNVDLSAALERHGIFVPHAKAVVYDDGSTTYWLGDNHATGPLMFGAMVCNLSEPARAMGMRVVWQLVNEIMQKGE